MDSKIVALLLFLTLGAAEKECWSNPCENGATCMDGSYGYYTCFCPSGWHGRNCEIELSTHYRVCSSGNVYNYTGEKIGFRTSSGATEDNECFYLVRIHGAETINITFQECSLDGEGDGVYIGWGNEIPTNGQFDEELCPGESHHIGAPMHWSFNVSMAWIHVKMNTNISAGYQFTISADGNDCSKKPCYNDGSCEDRLRDFHCDCRFGYHGKQCDDSTFTSASAMFVYIFAVIVVACLYALVLMLHRRRRRHQSTHHLPSIPDYPLHDPRPPQRGPILSCGPRQFPRSSQSGHLSERGTWRSEDFRNHDQPDLVRPVPEEGQHLKWWRTRKPPRHVSIDEPIPGNWGTRGSPGVFTVPSGPTSRPSLALAIFDYCPEQIDELTFYLIAESMNSDTHVYRLGRYLELPEPEIERYKASNFQRPEVTFSGTQRMLKDWQARTYRVNRWEHLYNALERAHFTDGMDILVKRSQEMIQITSVA